MIIMNMRRIVLVSMIAAALWIGCSKSEEPFSIVSMTLHEEALARAHDVELSGNLAFVPGKQNALSILDISDPTAPEIVWYMNDPGIPDSETVLLMGDKLLLGTKDFLTLDVSDPQNPGDSEEGFRSFTDRSYKRNDQGRLIYICGQQIRMGGFV